MDPIHRGPEEYGHDTARDGGGEHPGDSAAVARGATEATPHGTPRDAAPPAPAHTPARPETVTASSGAVAHIKGAGPLTPPPARTVQLIAGDLLLTVNPVDGSEIEHCPPGHRAATPARRTAEERAALQRAGRPPVPPGPAAPALPLLERGEERARLTELLGRGRSVRLTGAPGSGRTALLEAVAADCADLAPDGVVRLCGHRRTTTELLHELYAAVHHAPLVRPDRTALRELVRDVAAVVVLDDLELGAEALDGLLAATPECAYLLAATPETEPPSADARLEEVPLGGLGRGSSLELLERVVERALTDEEANWAGDLWFESEGLPLRFVQAGALLRQRDRLRAGAEASDEFEPFERPAEPAQDAPSATPFERVTGGNTPRESGEGADAYDIPLPSLGEGAAPAALLASRLSEAARATLRFAVALGGEVPHQAHLPALVGDTHADAALGELMSCGLLTPVGPRYRLAPGVAAQLAAHGYADDATAHAHTAAQHYGWWAGHPSVTPERVSAEADAILAAMGPLVPGEETVHPSAAVLLARSAAPAFLAGLHWGAWERVLRSGSEAARLAGEVAEEAYFHHELGVLALCLGNLDRARAELEASIGMRGAVADKIGTVAGRRALALVTDREGRLGAEAPTVRYAGAPVPAPVTPAPAYGADPAYGTGLPGAAPGTPGTGTPGMGTPGIGIGGGAPEAVAHPVRHEERGPATVVSRTPGAHGRRRPAFGGARRNLVAAGAGAVLAAVLGTVVTLGATSGGKDAPADKLHTEQTADPDSGEDTTPAEQPADHTDNDPGGPWTGGGAPDSPDPTGSASPSATASPSDESPSDDGTSPDDETPSEPQEPTGTPSEPSASHSPPPTGPSSPVSQPPTEPTDEPSEEPTDTESDPPPSSPQTTLSGPMPSATVSVDEQPATTAASSDPAEPYTGDATLL
ncbi:ATP-binding protein [Streptomyces corynorhini]|uniref:ATP-binding protein n=1 Tax=Streptomyces corynorhini TaxID=2282652 RepID=A0A370BAY1_9ACTN|nr:ATP-binding protein [Streptomyces corynorhini]RDG37539.1 ATP-binding protein [Streptomyces corynorhini]